ncbi:SCO-spondin [Lingula anatina]|uniref:SCO-spondin n=1 Tax=Lingula anatina TaxID=7574 RepID=A0A1S3JWU6_LINAN|nr:SCO-spondin [Lingula anatina]|eukprot:XP_013414531.1 SCO-spondin [Lingula anatina]
MMSVIFYYLIFFILLGQTGAFVEIINGISVGRAPGLFSPSFRAPPALEPLYFVSQLPPEAFAFPELQRQLSECTLDMCIAVDASGSLKNKETNGKTGWENEKIFATNLVRRVASFGDDISVRYANVVFGRKIRTWFDFTESQSTDHIIYRLETMPYLDGQTNIPDAMLECQQHLLNSGRNVEKVVLVLTDGSATPDLGAVSVPEAAESLKANGIRSIAVGAGNINKTELLVIAQGDVNSVFIAEDTSSLNNLVDDIGVSSCAKPNITTTTPQISTTTTPAPCPWSQWTSCDASCGGGKQTRTRKGCCEGCLDEVEGRACNTQACPGPCQWSDWSPCDIPCGGGVQTRTMIDCCDKCLARLDVRSCNTGRCPVSVDGQWGDWSAYGACTDSCGGGFQMRSRTCSNPSQAGTGKPCVGPADDIKKCNIQDCPVHGQWGDWCCSWSECSTTCGGGQRTRTRQCSNPAPANGGADCVGSSIEEEMCNTQLCPIDGGWTTWTGWSGCGVHTCYRTRTRTCTAPAAQHGGKPCPGRGTEVKYCPPVCCLGSYRSSYNQPWHGC